MTEQHLAWLMMGIGTVLVVGLLGMLTTLNDHDLSKPSVPPSTGEGFCLLAAAQKLGATIMSAVDAALARFTAFVSGVLAKIKVAQETNDVQTAKLAELQAALAAATADDATDKAAIANLQAEVDNLQAKVADQINAAIDALENPPVVEDEPVVEETPVDEVPVEETPETPVES